MKQILHIILAILVVAHCGLGSANAQETTPADENRAEAEAMTLIRNFAGTDDISTWLDNNRTKINGEVTAAADRIAQQALSNNRPDIAGVASLFAGYAHLLLSEREQALTSMFNYYQTRFMIAEKQEEYAAVRKSTLDLQKKAEAEDRMNLAFNFGILAADAAYFGCKATPEGKIDDKLLVVALQDMADTLSLIRYASSRGMFERFVSLVGAAIESATSQYYLSQEQLESVLKKMAPALELAIPPDFEFQVQGIGNRRKSIVEARILARYSYLHGSAAVGSARLAIAEQRAREEKDIDLALAIIRERYDGERKTVVSQEQLRRLRDTAWKSAHDFRASYHSKAGRIWASYRSDIIYGEMVNDQLAERSPDIAQSFRAIENLKARLLLDQITSTNVAGIATPQAQDLERKILGFSKPNQNDKTLIYSEMRLISQLSGFSSLGEDKDTRQDALITLESLYENTASGFQKATAPFSLEAVQKALEPHEALLEYVVPYHPLHPAKDLWMLFITRSRVWLSHVPLEKVLPHPPGFTGRISFDGGAPIDSSSLGILVLEARMAIRKSDEARAREELKQLHEILVQPLLDHGIHLEEFSRLVIVPHGPLHYVPFPALIDREGRFLISKLPVTIVPSASVWRILQSRSSNADRFVAFANPDQKGRGIPDLPFAEQEVSAIAKFFPVDKNQVFRRETATKDAFLSSSPKASLLHLSTHGEFPDDNALDQHAIWLADQSTNGPALSAADVRKTNLSATSLAILSVCNGGLYRIGPADEPYGLMPAFLEAGAQNVMGTLWPLDDQFGRDFMIEFYKHLSAEGPASAYRKASLRFIGEDEFIRRWAGFVLVGPGRPFSAASR